MTNDQKKYLIKRLDNIRKDKQSEIRLYYLNNYGITLCENETLTFILRYMDKNRNNLKFKSTFKLTPKGVYNVLHSSSLYSYSTIETIFLDMFDLSECMKEFNKIFKEMTDKYKQLNDYVKNFEMNLILKNDCDEILKEIKKFENFKI